MNYVNQLPHLSTVLCPLLVCLSLFVCDSGASDIHVIVKNIVEKESSSEENIKAVVLIESPKMGSLLHLRGIVGKGKLIIRQEDKVNCVSTPIRLAAGDFGGSDIAFYSIDVIRLVIYCDEVVNKLISGDEVVSEGYHVTYQGKLPHGDINIVSGLSPSYGFVLNPGEWSWSSLFGSGKETVSCDRFDRT